MIPATAIRTSRITMTMAVAGRKRGPNLPKNVGAPINGGPDYMKKGSVTVGRAGRLSVHTWDERALGMRGTVHPPSCMRPQYRPRRVIS
jgi:hypothetical protein